MIIIQATTPTFRYTLPEAASSYDDFVVNITQNGISVCELGADRLTQSEKTVSFTLTQEETAGLSTDYQAGIQMRVWKGLGTDEPRCYGTRRTFFEVYPSANMEVRL